MPAERTRPNLLLPAAGLLAFAAFGAVALADPALYAWLIDLWSFHPAPMTFVDTEGPLAWIRCWRMGVDIYAGTPCEVLGTPMNYSPALLRVPWPWVAPADVAPTAITLDVFFLVSLAVLPRPRARADAVAMLLALASPFCVFALERANFDLLMFVGIALALLALERGLATRLLGYAGIVAVGLLKLYPWALLLLLVRERVRVLLACGLVFAAVLAGYIGAFHAELPRMLSNLPQPNVFDDSFGSAQLPDGLAFLVHQLRGEAAVTMLDVYVRAICKAALAVATMAGALMIGTGPSMPRALATLTPRESLCLSVGAILMCAGFFSGASIGYRAVHLLFALPGMLALARTLPSARRAVGAAMLVLWSLPVQRVIVDHLGKFWQQEGPPDYSRALPGIVFWLLREAAWWLLIGFLLALVLRTVLDSRAWAESFGRVRAGGTGWT